VTAFNELEPALAAIRDDRMNGLATFQDALALLNLETLVARHSCIHLVLPAAPDRFVARTGMTAKGQHRTAID
jgi:hypothetical protein